MKRFIITSIILLTSCDISSQKAVDNPQPVNQIDNKSYDGMSRAYFASGCFWCVETIYESLDGVKEVYSGYAGGSTVNPNYYQVISGKTGHAEAIEIIYDNKIISFDTLLKVFFDSHDPTTPNRQGPDYGTQYRSIAFYSNIDERIKIKNYIDLLSSNSIFGKKIITEVKEKYYAEKTFTVCKEYLDYHSRKGFEKKRIHTVGYQPYFCFIQRSFNT